MTERVAITKAFDFHALALAECDRTEIVVTLYEHEKAGVRWETWPDAVKRLAQRELDQWFERNTTREVRALSTGIGKHNGSIAACVLVLHHAPRPQEK